MGFDKGKLKQICWIILYVALILFALLHTAALGKAIGVLMGILNPFFIGGSIAFILNIPMKGIEDTFFMKWQGKSAKALKRPISLLLSVLFLVAIVALLLLAVIPQLKDTINTLGDKIPGFLKEAEKWLAEMAVAYPALEEQLSSLSDMEFNWNAVIGTVADFMKNGVTNMVSSTVTVASGIIGGVTKGIIGFIFALYILAQKENLHNQINRVLDAYLSSATGERIRDICRRLYVNFTNFICGQCLEAVILGVLFIIAMPIFGMPYAIMIGTLIAFTALIPIVGAFIGCFVGAFMILIDNPVKALWFVVLFLVIQQIEGNLIYPKVVGNSVGLPSIWVLASVSVGGSLFGVVGMLVFIPLMSTAYSLLRDDVNFRNREKEISILEEAIIDEEKNDKKLIEE